MDHWHCSFCLALLARYLQEVEGAGYRSPGIIFPLLKGQTERGVDIQSATCPGRVYLHILTGCICYGCYFRLVLSLYI